ncbi:hypothetical protein GUJ93_ZPchr0008g11787 [Zizania palustris]|uniref:DJ-1/PfpI domain-containing protein n=1 Tax=Zizania palustris TaxID=103762 RepID=A0A8J5RYS8_ZIZPA|nr:hypothetical protein GUJ93_ZPchr0008g11787 [Zizania palustris]
MGTEEMEAVILAGVLRRAGAGVTLASVEDGLEVEASCGSRIVADMLIVACADQMFDLVALPGGMPGSVRLRDNEILQRITVRHAEEKRLYGAICAAPAVVLMPWGLHKRKKMTQVDDNLERSVEVNEIEWSSDHNPHVLQATKDEYDKRCGMLVCSLEVPTLVPADQFSHIRTSTRETSLVMQNSINK